MPSLLPPSEGEFQAFRESVSPGNPGIGIIDLSDGRVYLKVASQIADGDHASLAESALGIDDLDKAPHLRGFVLGLDRGRFQLANNSGLNPRKGKMEPELFESLKLLMKSQLESRLQE